MDERDLRAVLAERAEEIAMGNRPPALLLKRVKRRFMASILRGAVILCLLVGGGVFAARGDPDNRNRVPAKLAVPIELVDDYVGDGHKGRSEGDELPSEDDVRRHVDCMREQGFNLPDPVRTTDGWEIQIENPDSIGVDSPEWREAAFVTCAPSPPPGLEGDLVLGVPLPREAIEAFEECMEREGFTLPEATPQEDGGWSFDLSEAGIDFGDESWNRAVFVTCWIE